MRQGDSNPRRGQDELVDDLRNLVLHIVEEIVDHDEDGDITVDIQPGQHYMTVELHSHLDDIGQVVGQGGAVIGAVRTLLSAFGGKHRVQINLVYLTERKKSARSSK